MTHFPFLSTGTQSYSLFSLKRAILFLKTAINSFHGHISFISKLSQTEQGAKNKIQNLLTLKKKKTSGGKFTHSTDALLELNVSRDLKRQCFLTKQTIHKQHVLQSQRTHSGHIFQSLLIFWKILFQCLKIYRFNLEDYISLQSD